MESTETQVKHVAIIPDGNRRWAKKRGLLAWQGHIKAAENIVDIIKAAFTTGIPYLTIWGGSYDNLTKRSGEEINKLEEVYRSLARRVLNDPEVKEKGVRVRVLGEWSDILTPETAEVLREAEESTKKYNNYNLTLLIGYNGDREMVSAVNKLLMGGAKTASEETIKTNLWTKDLPPVDLIIRTGGEPHLSAGFMMWDVRYSQLYFTEKMWPDFTAEDFKDAIIYYEKRDRRLGA